MKRQILILSLLIFTFSSVGLINAHSPSGMVLDYDFDTDTLSVRVNHAVSDVNTHNIELIQIYVNGVFNTSAGYSSQTTTSYHEDFFVIPAVHGDVIMVNATCNISGNSIDQITLDDPAIPEFRIFLPLVFFIFTGLFLGWRMHKRHLEKD